MSLIKACIMGPQQGQIVFATQVGVRGYNNCYATSDGPREGVDAVSLQVSGLVDAPVGWIVLQDAKLNKKQRAKYQRAVAQAREHFNV